MHKALKEKYVRLDKMEKKFSVNGSIRKLTCVESIEGIWWLRILQEMEGVVPYHLESPRSGGQNRRIGRKFKGIFNYRASFRLTWIT